MEPLQAWLSLPGDNPMNHEIRRLILAVLRQHDGICLDNEEERERLADGLVEMLLDLLAHPTEEGAR